MEQKKTPKWFTQDDIIFTKKLFGYNQKLGDIYCKKYTEMMNSVHKTKVKPNEFKELCFNF
jgi:hypothetical protein